MSILFVLIPLSLALVGFACWGFFWAVGTGQFEELESAGWDVLREDDLTPHPSSQSESDSTVDAAVAPSAIDAPGD